MRGKAEDRVDDDLGKHDMTHESYVMPRPVATPSSVDVT
jgi:hypothetical protein